MIPCLAMVRVGQQHRAVKLWLPLFLLWPLLLPVVVVFAVAGAIVARAYGVGALGVLRTAWQLVSGWRGTHIEIDSPEMTLQVRFI